MPSADSKLAQIKTTLEGGAYARGAISALGQKRMWPQCLLLLRKPDIDLRARRTLFQVEPDDLNGRRSDHITLEFLSQSF